MLVKIGSTFEQEEGSHKQNEVVVGYILKEIILLNAGCTAAGDV